MQNNFDLIKEKIRLAQYVRKFVKLKSLGESKFVGLCPFHSEKTASFHVNDVTGLYHCFGCSKGGDLFSFYCEMNNCSKKKAYADLCLLCGINVKKRYEISLSPLLEFFCSYLNYSDFCLNRGVTYEFMNKFKIGWAPSYEEISSFLSTKKLDYSNLGFKLYFFKFFQNRVTFPIFDESGHLVSFAGRCLDQRDGKYVNGADSKIFHKSSLLYGLNFIKNREFVYLVEGYLDVIIMQQKGYSAVASMGTAVSSEQLDKLWNYTDKIIVLMDGDNAGKQASYKIALVALQRIVTGKEIYFMFMQENEDPASYLVKNDSLNFHAYPLYEFFTINNSVPSDPDKRALYFKKLIDLSNNIKDEYLRIEYKRKWNDLRWKTQNKKIENKLKIYKLNDLILLLFKYALDYNEILDDVGEDFLKLQMNNDYKLQLVKLLNGDSISSSLAKRIDQISYINPKIDFDNVLEEWYKIFNHIQCILDKERESKFLNDFSEKEWNSYKQWLKQKEDKNDQEI